MDSWGLFNRAAWSGWGAVLQQYGFVNWGRGT